MEIVRLEDVCTTTTSNLTLKELDKNNGAYPVYGASGLIKYIDFYNQDKEYIGIVKDGAGIGRVMLLPKNSSILGTMQYIFPNENIDIKYLYFNLIKMNLKKYYSGSTIPHIYFKDYKKEKIKLYSFEKQKKIAKILENISNIIEKKKQKLQEYELLSKCLFIKMFGDPILNEKKWRKKQLQEECEIITGNTPSRKEKNYYGNYIEWIKSDNIVPFNIYPTKAKEFLSENGVKRGRKIEKNNILMTCIAGSVNSIGNISITDRDVSFNQQINGIRVQENNVWFMFKQFELSKKYIQSSITMSLKGILSKSKLSELYFIFPPIELQNQFAERVKMIEKSKFEIQKSIEETQKLFDSLMKKYFG